jgi:hypothetical protein
VHVLESASDDPLDQRTFLRQLADRARLPLLWMDVHVGACDVHVSAQDERQTSAVELGRVRVQRFQEPHFRRKVLSPVGHVDRRDRRFGQAHADDPVLVIELRVMKRRTARMKRLANVKRNARVPLPAVPVAPVALELAEPHRQLIERRLDLLQAQHVGLFAFDEFLDLRLPRPDAVDVPRRQFHLDMIGLLC